MENEDKPIELENRYCPICDKKITIGAPAHKCNKKRLLEIEKERKKMEEQEENVEEERTFDDILREFDEYFNPDTYYDRDY